MYILYFYRSVVFYIIFLVILDNLVMLITYFHVMCILNNLIIFTCILHNINIKLLYLLLLLLLLILG